MISNKAAWLSISLVVIAASSGGCLWQESHPKPPKADYHNAAIEAAVTLRQLVELKDAVVRCNAIEALAETVGAKEAGVYMQALGDANPMVQFAGAMAIGDVKYEGAHDALLAMANVAGPDKRVYAAVIYALYRLKDNSHMGNLARLMLHAEPEVRADAALVIGRIGEPYGIAPLRQLLSTETDEKVRLQVVESLAMLGDSRGKAHLEAYTRTRFVDEQLVAIRAIGRVRPDRWEFILEDAMGDSQPMAVRVAAAGAAAQLGNYNSRNYQLCEDAAKNPDGLLSGRFGQAREISPVEATLVRRMGTIALGYMNRPQAVDVLLPLLRTEDGTIRVAAAMSILRLIPPVYSAPTTEPAKQQAPASAPASMPRMPIMASAPAAPATQPAATVAAEPPAQPSVAQPAASKPTPQAAPAPAASPAPVAPAIVPATEPTSEPAVLPGVTGDSVLGKPKLKSSGARD